MYIWLKSCIFFSILVKLRTSVVVFCQDTDGLISQALLVGNFEGAVDLCLNDGRYAEAILLSISGGEDLLKKTQQKYLSKQKNSVSMVGRVTNTSFQFVPSSEKRIKIWAHCFVLYFSPNLAAHLLSGDPELARHCGKLRVGQLEGGSRSSADVRPPWGLCLSVRWVAVTCQSSCTLPLRCSPSGSAGCLSSHPGGFPKIVIRVWNSFIVMVLPRHLGMPVREWKDGEALPAGLPVLHLLWEHWKAGGVLDLKQRQFFSSWSGGIHGGFSIVWIFLDSNLAWLCCYTLNVYDF